uniref:Uncharacterized protein n=1 Tax=Romanomermis culicivorax TaxID=13658 RepID=A0A915HU79_ROMCU
MTSNDTNARVPLKLEKPRRSTEKEAKIDHQSLTPEEKLRFSEEKLKQMRLKNLKWSQRFDEIEDDKKNAGFSGRQVFSKEVSNKRPPFLVFMGRFFFVFQQQNSALLR